MARKGLGKGLDSLIPDFYNEDFDSNSPQSLEDMLKDNEEEESKTSEEVESPKEEESPEKENIFDQIEKEMESQKEESEVEEEITEEEVSQNDEEVNEVEEDDETSEDIPGDISVEGDVPTSQEVQIQKEHVAEVKEIVDKNPRITLWSSKSSAVFRYLRKTEPEFSISKEASILIEEAVSKKYPDIWALFEDL